MDKKELEERLIDFVVEVRSISNTMSKSRYNLYLEDQLSRSATSAALNFGEAQGAESPKDFVHKLRLILKELRETHISLRIIQRSKIDVNVDKLTSVLDECNQLISIFVVSIKTANSKLITSR